MKFVATLRHRVPAGFRVVPDRLDKPESFRRTYEAIDTESIQSALDGEFDPAVPLNELLDLLGFTVLEIIDTKGIEV